MELEATRYCWDHQQQAFVLGDAGQEPGTVSTHHRDTQTVAFIKGPIPMHWLERAAQLPGKTIHAALGLWYVRSVTGREQFTVKRGTWERLNLTRQAYYRALRDLEAQGLITVERKPGRYPLVRLLDSQTPASTRSPAPMDDPPPF